MTLAVHPERRPAGPERHSMTSLADRGYQDALACRTPHEQLRFTWGYRHGFKLGTKTREMRGEAERRRLAA